MSLARVDRALEQFNLEPIATVGETFDPELMEVVEVVGDSGKPAGEVLEEVRRGYWRGEVVFRYAQVKVARGFGTHHRVTEDTEKQRQILFDFLSVLSVTLW